MQNKTLKKIVIGILGGIVLTILSYIYGAVAGYHNDQVRDRRAREKRVFDLNTAKRVPVIIIDKKGE